MARSLYSAPVNNAGLDPLQAFDCEVYTLDQATGQVNLIGGFRNVMTMVRNATEPYLELGQRIPRNLDGEIQIAFVLDRGMISTDWLERTFGHSSMTREMLIRRNTRFQITINYDAPQLQAPSGDTNFQQIILPPDITSRPQNVTTTRKAQGKNVLLNCKIDSVTSGIQAGRSVIDMRWEGIAEGIQYSDNPDFTIKQFLNATNTPVNNFLANSTSRSSFTSST